MRTLVLTVSLSVLCGLSYWALTSGPFSPTGGGVGELVAGVTATATAAGDAVTGAIPGPESDAGPAFDGEQAVYTRVRPQSYTITGATPDQMLASMLEEGPRTGEDIFFGLTETALDIRYDPVEVAGGCMIRNTRVYLDIAITLPEWTPPAGVASGTASDWARFRRALEAHEDRHRQIAVDGAEKAYLAVAELYRTSCPDAIEEGRRRLERIGVEVSAIHRRFDADTGHGKSEGAVWPVPDERSARTRG